MYISADVCDMIYTVANTSKQLRLVLIKPITGMNDSGTPVGRVLVKYNCTNIAKQLIVVFDDLNTVPGAITLQNGGDLRAVKGHGGVENIAKILKTNDFIRFRIGIGRPPTTSSEWTSSGTKNKVTHQANESMSVPNWVLSKFSKENKEMDLVGYSLEVLAQALGHFAATGDLKATKKKYCTSKKIPNNLKKYESLSFPVIIGGL
jgi:peptidyl-tRNA hydrolase, PTH1 family